MAETKGTTGKRVGLVLGAAVRPDGAPSPAMRRRVGHAVALWQAGAVEQLMLSGGQKPGGPFEAEVMAGLCFEGGVPAEALSLERDSLTTLENLRYCAPLLQGAAQIVLITDTVHGPRAKRIARHVGLDVTLDCPPHPGPPLAKLRAVLHEGAALVKYTLVRLGLKRA